MEGETRPGPWVVTCDHATNRVPPEIGGGSLGIDAADMARHIAYDVGAENPAKRNRLFEGEERGASALRPYAEFALYDEETNSLAWIPVDIVAMSGRSSRLPPNFLDRPQPYFGTNKELDSVIPIAFGYVPERATIGAEAPAFYGVRFDPPARLGMQSQIVTIGATRMVNRGRR